MEDLIRRSDALGCFHDWIDEHGYIHEADEMTEYQAIEALPSALPKPHGRLIDADALMKTCGMAIDCYDCPNGEHGWCKLSSDAANICEAIEDAPTIIPAEEGE